MREITIHEVADRHRNLHGREFARTQGVTVEPLEAAAAITSALEAVGLSDTHGRLIVTIDWPHDGDD